MEQGVTLETGRVATEGDELYFEVRGSGRPLLMIAGGLGDAGIYAFVAEILASEYRVITYDRRGQSRSTRRSPQNFEISQQARDAVAVLRAAGEASAIVFGNSLGAVIGLEMARRHPAAVQALIAHEPPTVKVLPDADIWLSTIARIYLAELEISHKKAVADFTAAIAIPPTMPEPELEGTTVFQEIDERQRATASSEFGIRHELVAACQYDPATAAIRKNGTKVVLGVGKLSQELGSFYARTVPILAERLMCEEVVFPGHHGSYMVTPREWSAVLGAVLRRV